MKTKLWATTKGKKIKRRRNKWILIEKLEGYRVKCPFCGHEKKTFKKISKCNYCLHYMYIDESDR